MRSFHWVIEGRLAGSGRPGVFNPMPQDLDWLQARGIRLIVTLTEEPLDPPVDRPKIEALHFPIPDMGIPTLSLADAIYRSVGDALDQARPVLLHCRAGLGRTGMILACCLSYLGYPAEDAIVRVRKVNYHYIQTEGQEDFVREFADHLRSPAKELPRLKLPTWARSRACGPES